MTSAVAHLTVQCMVALGEARFPWVLGVVAIAEPFCSPPATRGRLRGDRVRRPVRAATSVLALGLTARRRWRAPPPRH
jgi:hypothetical protein